jgi:hypothetical protein
MTLRPSRHALTATRAAQERQGEHGRSMHTSARLACCRVPLGSRATKTVLSLASLGATLLCGTHDGAILLVRAGAIVGEVALAHCLGTQVTEGGAVLTLAVDEDAVVSGGADGLVRVWSLAEPEEGSEAGPVPPPLVLSGHAASLTPY